MQAFPTLHVHTHLPSSFHSRVCVCCNIITYIFPSSSTHTSPSQSPLIACVLFLSIPIFLFISTIQILHNSILFSFLILYISMSSLTCSSRFTYLFTHRRMNKKNDTENYPSSPILFPLHSPVIFCMTLPLSLSYPFPVTFYLYLSIYLHSSEGGER